MRSTFFVFLLMFAGAALMGSDAFAGSCGCKRACGASTEKKAATKADDGGCGGGGCGGCGGGTCTKTKDAGAKEAGTVGGCEGCGSKNCAGCKGCEAKKEVKAETKTGDVYTVVVTEMCCAGCGKSVAAKIKKIDGVANVAVDVEKGTVTITMNEGKTIDKAAIETALKGTDFGVTSCDKVVKVEEKKEEPKKEASAETPKKECEGCGKKASN
ncbi:MAG: heavy-metal-associated domain-containing protein [Planctomycetes bacterium]|nr:heavy-metal-associated domain-containing protein [Planctomycetota bacterium]